MLNIYLALKFLSFYSLFRCHVKDEGTKEKSNDTDMRVRSFSLHNMKQRGSLDL